MAMSVNCLVKLVYMFNAHEILYTTETFKRSINLSKDVFIVLNSPSKTEIFRD